MGQKASGRAIPQRLKPHGEENHYVGAEAPTPKDGARAGSPFRQEPESRIPIGSGLARHGGQARFAGRSP